MSRKSFLHSRGGRHLRVASFAIAVVACMLVALGTAGAQDKKKSDIPDKPKVLQKEPKAANPDDSIPKGPSATRDDFDKPRDPEEVRTLQEKIRRLNASQIDKIDRILDKSPNHARKADMLFQKAELMYEVLTYDSLLKRAEWLKCLEAADQGSVDAKGCKEPIQDYGDALGIYKEVLQQFPSYARLDEVIFRLGDGLMKADKKKEGVSFLNRLVQNYPQSKYLADAHLAIAEFFFDSNLLIAALESYKSVLKFKGSPLYNYALYKMAWVLYNQKEFRQAVDTFKQVVIEVERDKSQAKLSFANQALNDLVVSWAEIEGGWKEAREYFYQKRDKEFTHKKLRQMAGLYDTTGRNEPRVEIFEFLLQAEPTSPDAPDYWEAIIDGKKKIGVRKEWEESVREMIGYFDPKAKWWGANGGNKNVTGNARLLAEGYLAQLATEYHQKAQKDNDLALYKQAAKDYKLYLEKFSDSESAYDMRFYYAEILFDELKEYEEAANQYKQVIDLQPTGKYAKDCQFARIKSYENLVLKEHPTSVLATLQGDAEVRLEAVEARKKPGKDGKLAEQAVTRRERSELFKWEKPFVDASDDWAKVYPKEENTPTVMFVAAEVFRAHGQYDNSVSRYEHIIKFAPKHRYASYAGNSLLECNNELGRWSEIERWARYLLDNKIFDVTPKDKLQDAIAYAISKKADDLQAAKNYDEAAGEMLRLALEWPESDLAPGALFNAAAIYEKADKIKLAVENYEKLIKTYPTHDLAPEAIFVMGAIFEARTDFESAATYFERLGDNKKWRDEFDKAQDAIYNAGVIREALEQWSKAIATYERFVKLYPKSEQNATLEFHIGELYEKAGNKKAAEKAYLSFVKKYKDKPEMAVHAYLHLGMMARSSGGKKARKDAEDYFGRTWTGWTKLADEDLKKKTTPYAAEARFQTAEFILTDYKEVKLAFPIATLQKRATSKGELLTRAEAMYFEVVNMRNPFWTAAAAYRIGEMYKNFSDELYNLPLPEGLPEEAEFEYRGAVDDLSFPLQEKSLKAFQKALSLALELNAYNEWSALSAREMSRLEQESYPLTEHAGVETRHGAEIYLQSKQLSIDDVKARAEEQKKLKAGGNDAKPSVETSQR